MTRWPSRSKFNAVRTQVDGIAFASKKEAARYQQLRLLEMAGEIHSLQVHPKFTLWAWPSRSKFAATGPTVGIDSVGKYTADFSYITKDGEVVVEDVKSKATKTTAYQLRKRIFEVCHWPLTVTEV